MAQLKKEKIPFTQVANEVLNDPSVSLKAKGLYAYLFSKPDGWDFSSKRIPCDHKDSIDSIQSGLRELEEQGFLIRKRQADGRVEYTLRYSRKPIQEKPVQVQKPVRENPSKGKSLKGKIPYISNKDNIIIKNSNKKENTHASISYLEKIPDGDIQTFTTRFIATEKEIKSKGEDLKLYCESKGRVYKNYKSFLLNALKNDFKEREASTNNKYANL
jgi:hypothetical protein